MVVSHHHPHTWLPNAKAQWPPKQLPPVSQSPPPKQASARTGDSIYALADEAGSRRRLHIYRLMLRNLSQVHLYKLHMKLHTELLPPPPPPPPQGAAVVAGGGGREGMR